MANSCFNNAAITYSLDGFLLVDVEFLMMDFWNLIPNTKDNNRPHVLSEFPLKIKLFGASFNLIGVLVHRTGHYLAYTRRTVEKWTIFDNKSKRCDRMS